MTLSPIMIFVFGFAMGIAAIALLGIAAANYDKKKKDKKNWEINDDLVKELFKEYLKETKHDES